VLCYCVKGRLKQHEGEQEEEQQQGESRARLCVRGSVCVRRAASGIMPATANSWILLLLLLVAVERCSSNSSGRINSRSSSSGYRKVQWQEQQEAPTLRPLPDKGTCAISVWLISLSPSSLSLPRILIVVNLRCINLA